MSTCIIICYTCYTCSTVSEVAALLIGSGLYLHCLALPHQSITRYVRTYALVSLTANAPAVAIISGDEVQ